MRARIQEIWAQVKWGLEAALTDWGLVLVVFLVALGSFGLGKLSATEAAEPAVGLKMAPTVAEPKGLSIGGLVVASRTGSIYYFPWCGSALNIKTENQVWFASEEAAQKAGYVPAKNCKGLTGK